MRMSVNGGYRTIVLSLAGCILACDAAQAVKVDYSKVQVAEEVGVEFIKVTKTSDYVYMPLVKRKAKSAAWDINRVLGVSKNGDQLAYISLRNGTTNIFIKDLDKQGGSTQRTNRTGVQDFTFSPDGKYILFSEARGKSTQLFRTDAQNGYICRQITSGDRDYSPIYSPDMKQVFFTRLELRGASVWGYDAEHNYLASYVSGMSPYPLPNEKALVVSRVNDEGRCELWKVNYDTGAEECIVADPLHSFTSPTVSPDGAWIVFVGDGHILLNENGAEFVNTDIFACRIDGTELTQLTYHAADDLSPVWSKDGKYIYFISQRGDSEGFANVWRMTFNH